MDIFDFKSSILHSSFKANIFLMRIQTNVNQRKHTHNITFCQKFQTQLRSRILTINWSEVFFFFIGNFFSSPGSTDSYIFGYFQRLPLTRALEEFSWTSINCFHYFLTLSDREGSLVAEWRAKTLIKEQFRMRTAVLIISLTWGITFTVKITRSLRAEWNSWNTLYSLIRKSFQVVYLFIWLYENKREAVDDLLRSRNQRNERYHTDKGETFFCEWRLFSKMNFYLSFFLLSNRIKNYLQYQELRRVANVYGESLCQYSANKSIIWVSSDKHSTNSYFSWSWNEAVSVIL